MTENNIPETVSFKVWVNTGEANLSTNALAFATEPEAKSYGQDLYMRWTLVRSFEVLPSTEKVSARWDDEERRLVQL